MTHNGHAGNNSPANAPTSATGQGVRLDTIHVRADPHPEDSGYTVPESSAATGLSLSLKDTPQSVSVVTEKQMREQQLGTVSDILRHSPGVSLFSSTPGDPGGYGLFQSRGFNIGVQTANGASAPDDNGSGATALSSSAIYETATLVRGATGMMDTIGDPGGTLVLTRKQPTRERGLAIEAGAGSWQHGTISVDATGALDAGGKLRGRAILAHDHGGFWQHGARQQASTGYAALEYDLSPATLLRGGVQYDRSRVDRVEPTINRYYRLEDDSYKLIDTSRRANYAPDWQTHQENRLEAFTTLEHRFTNGWQLDANYAYARSRTPRWIFMGANAAGSSDDRLVDISTNENHNKKTDNHDLALNLGGNYTLFGRNHQFKGGIRHHDNKEDRPYQALETYEIDLDDFNSHIPRPAIDESSTQLLREKTRHTSLFAASQFNLSDRWQLTLGGRVARWEPAPPGSTPSPRAATAIPSTPPTHARPCNWPAPMISATSGR